jgi:hypothetical protein
MHLAVLIVLLARVPPAAVLAQRWGSGAEDEAGGATGLPDRFRWGVRYHEGAGLDQPLAGSSGTYVTFLDLQLDLVANVSVTARAEGKLDLEAWIGHAFLRIGTPAPGKIDEPETIFGATWSGFLKGVRLDVSLSPGRSVLGTDLRPILKEQKQASGKIPVPRPDEVEAKARYVIERVFAEAFLDHVPSAGKEKAPGGGKKPAGKGGLRRYPLVNAQGRSEGVFEIAFGPPRPAAGDIAFQTGALSFTPPGASTIRLPHAFVHLSFSEDGKYWSEWEVKPYPAPAGPPGPALMSMAPSRNLSVTFKSKCIPALPPDGEDKKEDGDLPASAIAPGQVFLLDVRLEEDLKAAGGKGAGRWARGDGLIAARVVAAEKKLRLSGEFVQGTLSPGLLRSGPPRGPILLAGLPVSLAIDASGVQVDLEAKALEKLCAAAREDPARVRQAIERWLSASLTGPFTLSVDPPPPLAVIPLIDGKGAAAGEYRIAREPKPFAREEKQHGSTAELTREELRYKVEGIRAAGKRAEERRPLGDPSSFSVAREKGAVLPVSAGLTVQDLPAPPAKGRPPAPAFQLKFHAGFSALQVLGPRYRLPLKNRDPFGDCWYE